MSKCWGGVFACATMLYKDSNCPERVNLNSPIPGVWVRPCSSHWAVGWCDGVAVNSALNLEVEIQLKRYLLELLRRP